MSAIRLKNVFFTYDGQKTPALDGANFFLEYGELVLLSGVSGSGKSTLMNVICGIIPNVLKGALEGEIYIDGKSARGLSMNEVCRKVGVVLQNADAQIIHDKVEAEIAFGCENLGMTAERIEESVNTACERMELDKNGCTRTLSGGQKQRLITASVMAMRQRILLLDEPLANLDVRGARTLMTNLQNLAKSGYAVLVIEHRLDAVMQYADRVWHLQDAQLYCVKDKTAYLSSRAEKLQDGVGRILGEGNAFSLEDVKYEVKKKEILRGVNLDIPMGGRTLLTGDNGCGKTTLMRIIARLIRPSSGKMCQYIEPKLRRAGAKWFASVGVVYQNPDYQLFMPSVKKEILFGAKDKKYALDLADRFGIVSLFDRHPHSLSEGQKRLVGVCAVLATRPKVLLLDEPTVGQDYAGLKRMTSIINDLHSETGNTVITVTHDSRCAQALCDKAVLISDGAVKEIGGKDKAAAMLKDISEITDANEFNRY